MNEEGAMFELKPLSKEAIPRALKRAERYRLLNEPREAESICCDVLKTEPENQEALVMLLLALTDQFRKGSTVGVNQAREILPRLKDEYEKLYYAGVICERWGKFQLKEAVPAHLAHGWLREAMNCFERAEALSPWQNEDAILRWNACARIITREHQAGRPAPEASSPHSVDEEVPPR